MSAFCADGSRDACRSHLGDGLRLLGEIGWSSYPFANPRLSAFVQARSVRWGTEPGTAARLAATTNAMERSAAFRRELESSEGQPEETARLLGGAATDLVRGLTDVAVRLVDSRDRTVAACAQRYLTAIRQQELPALHVKMLGTFSVSAEAMPISFARRKSRLLFQMLLIEHPSPIHEEEILEALWPEASPKRGLAALQTAVKDLRRALDPYHEPRGKSYIVYADEAYALHLSPGSVCDSHVFEASIRRVLGATPARDVLNATDEASLREALHLFGGEAVPDLRLESFAQEYRERLHRWFLDASLRLARSLNARGNHADACRALERALSIDPLWGEGVQEIMLALARNGELCRALRAYREYERRLRRDLSLSPDVQLRRFFESLLLVPEAHS
jgi:DNA-binding SARP family transcriptional activator